MAIISGGLNVGLSSGLGAWGIAALSFAMSMTAATIVNFGKPEIRGAIIYEGFPGDWYDEEERDLKWIGTFDVPNTWARIQGAVGQDVASKYYNNLVNNGLTSNLIWRSLLIMTFFAVLSAGLFEVFLPTAAEYNYVTIMTILLHMMVTVPLLIFFNQIGRFDKERPVLFIFEDYSVLFRYPCYSVIWASA